MAVQCNLKDNKTSPEVREHRKFIITWGVLKQTSKKVIRTGDLCHLNI